MQALVARTRSNRVESIHTGFVTVSDPQKNVIYSIGDPAVKIYLRSTAKPFQAVPLVDSGAMDKFGISAEELAVICSSHSSQDIHLDAVSSILDKIGLGPEYLSCGSTLPFNNDMKNAVIKKGIPASPIYNCCSGKHAGMLALCRFYNYPLEGYTEPGHPVQQLIVKTISQLLGTETDEIQVGLDGCGVPTFVIEMNQASYLYAILAQGSDGKNMYRDAIGVIQKAMSANPRMINGDNEFCTELISASSGRIIGKVGAEGIYCSAVLDKQLGICVKISDGNERGVYPSTTHILNQLGALDLQASERLKSWEFPIIKNHRGDIVGHSIPVVNIKGEGNEVKIGDILN